MTITPFKRARMSVTALTVGAPRQGLPGWPRRRALALLLGVLAALSAATSAQAHPGGGDLRTPTPTAATVSVPPPNGLAPGRSRLADTQKATPPTPDPELRALRTELEARIAALTTRAEFGTGHISREGAVLADAQQGLSQAVPALARLLEKSR